MANYPLPVRGVAYKFETGLAQQADTKLLQSNPTLAAGDAKWAKDDGSLTNLTTLPYSTNSDKRVEVAISATEATCDNGTLIMSDAAGAQWCDQLVNVQFATRGIDDLAYPTTSGRSMDVDASGGLEVGSFQAGAITAAAIATDAIDADALAQSALDEINAALIVTPGNKVKTNTSGHVTTSYTIVKNVAFNNFEFEMVLSSDHVSPATGKTVTCEISKDGGAYAASTNAASEVGSGTYKINLAAADVNANMLTLKFTAAGCDTTKIAIVTQS